MRRQYAALFLLSFGSILFSSFTTDPAKPLQKQALHKIIIDPGHGGADFGASGAYSKEKDITLAISLKLNKLLNEEMPDVETSITAQQLRRDGEWIA